MGKRWDTNFKILEISFYFSCLVSHFQGFFWSMTGPSPKVWPPIWRTERQDQGPGAHPGMMLGPTILMPQAQQSPSEASSSSPAASGLRCSALHLKGAQWMFSLSPIKQGNGGCREIPAPHAGVSPRLYRHGGLAHTHEGTEINVHALKHIYLHFSWIILRDSRKKTQLMKYNSLDDSDHSTLKYLKLKI